MPYAELQATSNFSFLRGAAHPEELVVQAKALGLAALALADRNTLAGVVRGHLAAKEAGLRYVVGARLDVSDGASTLCFPIDRAAYGRLARLITVGRRCAPKGECEIARAEVWAHGEGQIFVVIPPVDVADETAFAAELAAWAARFPGRVYCAVSYLYRGDDRARLARLEAMADAARAPLLATNDVHYHIPARRPLQDVLTCIREHCTVDDAGYRLFANAERYVKPPAEMARLFADYPDALARTVELVDRCRFALDELRYEYPDASEEAARDPQAELVRLAWAGAAERYPGGIPDKVKRLLDHELALIGQLTYAPYFLTVHDTVRFAKSQGILCQGRGSAANSAVCYCLGITAVDPDRIDLLFERFVSAERNEPPDIDVDFEHERREEVIQYIYGKYGRDRAGLTAVVISYRWRSAIREVAKALGLSADVGGALAGYVWGQSSKGLDLAQVRELGLDPEDARLWLALRLAKELTGFPRHLSQHPGGFVMSRGPLCEVVPIANAAMPDRTTIEWDKDDIDALGILKVDVLGLGMLTCIRKAFYLIERHHGRALTLANVPAEDPAVYDMLCLADSVGVFQVESRAQMTMLPRLKPRSFYDLVIEVAIVRPGPIQGDMVHPYLRRRSGQEPVAYPSEALRNVLAKTYGVPLFQEQAMQIAIVGASFAPAEADRLRRAMATFRRMGTIHTFREKFIAGMIGNGYAEDYAVRCFKQIEGFGDYGFPESHAASFALLVYVSSWLKCHYPAAFACALLNSQPMGFYAPAQIVRDARDHGVRVLPVDVNASQWDCTLEPPSPACRGRGSGGKGDPAWRAPDDAACSLRLGLREVKGFGEADAHALVAARTALPEARFADMHELWRRSGLGPATLALLADADAFGSLGLSRRQALWAVKGFKDVPLPLFAAMESLPPQEGEGREGGAEPPVDLPVMPIGEEVLNDYAAMRLSLKSHPLALLRPAFARAKHITAATLAEVKPGARVKVAGLVIGRQRPGTASGVIFMTLEDETGVANVIVWPRMFEQNRKTVLRSRLLSVTGKVEREGLVIHIVADRMRDETARLFDLGELDSLTGFDVRHAHAAPAPATGYATRPLATGYATRPLATGGNANNDHLKMGFVGGPADQAATGRPSDPGTVARRLFPSRDFH
ncbi:MAG: error-prone DNA polymerase [Alphaproteobacteria bacterium]|nr:error-prone DNA polymerase [Alphaproteobacteria bacterium]